ncbi:cell division cycle-associated protein 8 [Nitzschia inconspicua]|uniref:Cell division cycle-associated protein 8 n=1 Tax=Nitzschia inconspicua TaxID=303405 RepID=A0A9K3KMJ9_9STRA|nr:cell division cycle-associated protein 8 [Nitzschia inconspicua]
MSRSPLQAQQNRWRSATKRQILGNFSSHTNSPVPVDGSNSEHIKMLITQLEQKYDQIVIALKSELENYKMEQEEVQSTGLIKLPKAVRNMTVKEFNQQHSCDLLALLKSKDGVHVAKIKSENSGSVTSFMVDDAAGKKKRDFQQHAVMETPAPRSRQDVPATAVRTARRGEGLFSRNGSPVETSEKGSVIATVSKKRRGNESANFEINVGDGRYISLNDPNGVQELDSEMKATAATQLKVLQDQMASLMAQLTK